MTFDLSVLTSGFLTSGSNVISCPYLMLEHVLQILVLDLFPLHFCISAIILPQQ
jgi:hypothetical protein